MFICLTLCCVLYVLVASCNDSTLKSQIGRTYGEKCSDSLVIDKTTKQQSKNLFLGGGYSYLFTSYIMILDTILEYFITVFDRDYF